MSNYGSVALSYLESIVRCRGANETSILVLSRSIGLVKI